MPSDSFWEPAEQFRAPRTANVLNSSLGALGNIDNVLNENERQNQRLRRPMFYVAPEDSPSEATIDAILEKETNSSRVDTARLDKLYGETRPEPSGSGFVTHSPYASLARHNGYLYGSPEYDHLLTLQDRANSLGYYPNKDLASVGLTIPELFKRSRYDKNVVVRRNDLFQMKNPYEGEQV